MVIRVTLLHKTKVLLFSKTIALTNKDPANVLVIVSISFMYFACFFEELISKVPLAF